MTDRKRTIASERMRLGLTQDALAQKLGKNRSSIVRWESDPSTMTVDVLEKMVDLFDCSADYLLGRCNERVPFKAEVNA